MKKTKLFFIFVSHFFILSNCIAVAPIGTEALIEEFLIIKLENSDLPYEKILDIKEDLKNKNYLGVKKTLERDIKKIDFYIELSLLNILLCDFSNANKNLFNAKTLSNKNTPSFYEDIISATHSLISLYFSGELDDISSLKGSVFSSNPDLRLLWFSILHLYYPNDFPFRITDIEKMPNTVLSKKINDIVFHSESDNYIGLYYVGKKLSLSGKYFEALEILKKADASYKKGIWTYSRALISYELCKIYFHIGKQEEFEEEMKKLDHFFELKQFKEIPLYVKLLKAESLRMSDYVKESEILFFEALNSVYQTELTEVEILALIGIADIFRITGKISKSLRFYDRALKLVIHPSNNLYYGQIYRGMGILFLKKGNYNKALSYLILSKENSEELSDMLTLSKTLISIGRLYLALGELGKARREYEYALMISRKISNPWIEVQVLTYLADLERMINHNPSSKFLYKKAIEVGIKVNDRAKIAMSEFGLAVLSKYEEKYQEALSLYRKALSTYETIEHLQGKGMCYIEIGEVYSLLKDSKKADVFFKKAIMQFDAIEDKYGLVKSWRKYALHKFRYKNYSLSESYAEKAYTISSEISNEREKGKIEILLAQILIEGKEYSKALPRLENSINLFKRNSDYLNLSEAYKVFALVHKLLEENEKAKNYLEKSQDSINTLSQLAEKK